MKKGDKISVISYICSYGTANKTLRLAEVSVEPKEDDELIWVRFLDVKFRKGKRSLNSEQVLRNKIVEII